MNKALLRCLKAATESSLFSFPWMFTDYSVDKGLQDMCNPFFIIMKRVGVNNRILNFLAKHVKYSEPTAPVSSFQPLM